MPAAKKMVSNASLKSVLAIWFPDKETATELHTRRRTLFSNVASKGGTLTPERYYTLNACETSQSRPFLNILVKGRLTGQLYRSKTGPCAAIQIISPLFDRPQKRIVIFLNKTSHLRSIFRPARDLNSTHRRYSPRIHWKN